MKTREFVPVVFACLLLAGCAPAATAAPPTTGVEVAPSSTPPRSPTPFQPLPPTPTPRPERTVGVLLGADWDPAYPERVQYGIRTDVFVVYVVEPQFDPMRISLFAVPRDLWVQFPGLVDVGGGQAVRVCAYEAPWDRANAAWYRGYDTLMDRGPFNCVRRVVEENFGLEVNAPIVYTEMAPFISMVDAFGGVVIIPAQTYTDWCGDYNGTAGHGGEWVTWMAGRIYRVDGNRALCYVRGRRVPTGDLDRNRRALEVLIAMKNSWGLPEPQALATFAYDLLEYVDMDLDFQDMWTAAQLLPRVSDAEVRLIRMGTNETDFWRTPGGASVVVTTVNPAPWLACMIATGNREACTASHPVPDALACNWRDC